MRLRTLRHSGSTSAQRAPCLARLSTLTELDRAVEFCHLDVLAAGISELRFLQLGYDSWRGSIAEMVVHTKVFERCLPAFHRLDTLDCRLPPTWIQPPTHRERLLRRALPPAVLLTALRESHQLTRLTLQWPHLAGADLAALLSLPMPLRLFRLIWPTCSCGNALFRCTSEDACPNHFVEQVDPWDDEPGLAVADRIAAAAAGAVAAAAARPASLQPCTTLTEVDISNEGVTSRELGVLLRLMPSVRQLRLELPRLSHLRGFAQAGVARQLETLVINSGERGLPGEWWVAQAAERQVAAASAAAAAAQIGRLEQVSYTRRPHQLDDNHHYDEEEEEEEKEDEEEEEARLTAAYADEPWSKPSLLCHRYFSSATAGAVILAPLTMLSELKQVTLFHKDVMNRRPNA